MDYSLFTQYIRAELLVLVLILYAIGVVLKSTSWVKDEVIPFILGIISILLCAIYIIGISDKPTNYQEVLILIFNIIIQGICCAACSVYVHQIWKQSNKLKGN